MRYPPSRSISLALWVSAALCFGQGGAPAAKVKFIRLEKNEPVLNFAEVQVFSGGQNVAPKGKAAQSSTANGGAAGKGSDGNTEGAWAKGSVIHTDPKESNPWWELELAEASVVDEIAVWNRTDCCGDRLDGVALIALDPNRKPLARVSLRGVKTEIHFKLEKGALTKMKPANSLLSVIQRAKPLRSEADEIPSPYLLYYDKPAPLDLKGWEFQSLPLGNGHFGVSFFGGIGEELWQFCEKSLYTRDATMTNERAYDLIGLSSFAELRLSMDHGDGATNGYCRELDIGRALGRTRYEMGGTVFERELLASYPARVFAARLTASKAGKVSFRLRALQPYLGPYRSATARLDGKDLVLEGRAQPYQLGIEIRVAVKTVGGSMESAVEGPEGVVRVSGADEALILVALGTSYRLESGVFTTGEKEKKLEGKAVPSERIKADLGAAAALGWGELRKRHIADHRRLFDAAQLRLGSDGSLYLTDRLLASEEKTPAQARALEELYFQYGRYLLIASSRKGTLPANLQGTWNMNRKAPWTGGYWANINIQMNYWPAFVTGLEETFEPYFDLFQAMFAQQQAVAASTLRGWKRERVVEDGWTAGTGNNPYYAGGPGSTSGSGTGPFVLLPLWDWYLFTGDKKILEKLWPFLVASCRFLDAAMKVQPDGLYLCDPSWSPENKKGNEPHVNLPGTAYDQQLVYENHRMTLEAARLLGKDDPILAKVRQQLSNLSPVIVGSSGQIKEFRQEQGYGEFGDPHHRHISHLIGLYPGTVITEKKEWLAAARVSLELRGDRSTGWAMAHRLNAWARLADGDRALTLLQTLLANGTMPNLWDTHPPFQIDGNFGGTSGMAEMLLQSHRGFLELLPSLPKAWAEGSYSGFHARGGFVVSAVWKGGALASARVESRLGLPCRLLLAGNWIVRGPGGEKIDAPVDGARCLVFPTKPGGTYGIERK
ncbi:MAG: glycoside hydrolase N-terminal domain-containing protein [Spirochaetes bacterium]|nr:glycoside hydrolase N-terminal domain-containing protein [Spirochaetota bacterium]